ncbi:OmpA family protein [bacterium]|nr:OmpA family protein [bacterium]
MKTDNLFKILLSVVILLNFAGCTVVFQKGRTSDIVKISELSKEINKLSKSKAILEKKLKEEISDKKVSLSMQEKGLVVTFLSEVLFDSGKSNIIKKANISLDKVADVLLKSASGMDVGIEGHTDNQPIKYSGWESNWELSGARARSVLNYLIKRGVSAERLSFIGYGEYRPVVSNATKEDRQKNRRVEIVILPTMTKDRQIKEAPKKVSKPKLKEAKAKENLK